jgi:mono/diheme cytochrome c family protein
MKWNPSLYLGVVTALCASLTLLPKGTAQGYTPTYYTDIQPILEKHCVSCHVAGGIAPFALDSGKAAVDNATEIARVVKQGSMPPWMPGEDSPPFLNDPRLGTASKQLIADWDKFGALLGKPLPNQKP